jgi:hypothetical protein
MDLKQKRTVSVLVRLCASVASSSVLSSCSTPDQSTQIVLPRNQPGPTKQTDAVASTEPQPGFIRLPSDEEVVDSYPVGRLDPFAPVDKQNYLPPPRFVYEQGAKSSKPSGLSEEQVSEQTKEFIVTGVVKAAGHVSALVSNAGNSGSVRVGDQGGKPGTETQFLLPTGWKVVSISPATGSVTIEKMGTKLTLSAGGG